MRGLLRRLFGPRPTPQLPPETNAAEVLEYLGAPPIVASWAAAGRRSLEAAWAECPRADWLLAIASRAGVPLDRLARAVRELDLPLASADWTGVDDLVADLESALDGAQEVAPESLRDQEDIRNQRRAPLSDRRQLESELRANVDATHDAFHGRHADRLREAIPYRDIRAVLYGQPASSPYR